MRARQRHPATEVRFRHHPRLISPRRSATPISEARERPRMPIRGRFSLRRPQGSFSNTRAISRGAKVSLTRFFRHPKHPVANVRTSEVHARVRQQRIPPRGAQALRRDARRGRRRGTHERTNCRLATAGNAEHHSNGVQRHGLASHPVRAALPRRMPNAGRGYSAMTKCPMVGQRLKFAGSRQPVRFRFVNHWIAQTGRASDG